MKKKNGYGICKLIHHYYEGDKWVTIAEGWTRKQLVNYMASWDVLENYSTDMSETKPPRNYKSIMDLSYFEKRYTPLYHVFKVMAGEYRDVNLEGLKREIDEHRFNREMNRSKRARHRQKANEYSFRNDPVPCVHKRHWHCGWRTQKGRMKTVRDNTDPDNLQYYSPKFSRRNTSICNWDYDHYGYPRRSWKYQYKVSKQWMIHQKRHMDTYIPDTTGDDFMDEYFDYEVDPE